MKLKCLSSAVLLVSSAGFAFDIESSTDLSATVSGYHYAEVVDLPISLQGPEYQLNGILTGYWNVFVYPSDATQLNFRYGLNATTVLDEMGSAADTQTSSALYRVDDLPEEIEWTYRQNLDQLSLTWYSGFGDYTFGRQPISFGQARFYSPIDVIQPAAVFAQDRNYRPGVDAVRATWQLGAVSEIGAGYVFGNDTVAFARLKAYALSTDWEIIGLRLNDNNYIASIGSNMGFGTVGVWQETAVLMDADSQYLRATVGADYTLFDDLYLMAELHYNGVGSADDYTSLATNRFYQLGAVVPKAKWYSSAQASYPLNIVTQLSGGVSANLNDGSMLVNGAVGYNATDTLSINLSALMPLVKEHSLDYEYGAYPLVIEFDLDWVF